MEYCLDLKKDKKEIENINKLFKEKTPLPKKQKPQFMGGTVSGT